MVRICSRIYKTFLLNHAKNLASRFFTYLYCIVIDECCQIVLKFIHLVQKILQHDFATLNLHSARVNLLKFVTLFRDICQHPRLINNKCSNLLSGKKEDKLDVIPYPYNVTQKKTLLYKLDLNCSMKVRKKF